MESGKRAVGNGDDDAHFSLPTAHGPLPAAYSSCPKVAYIRSGESLHVPPLSASLIFSRLCFSNGLAETAEKTARQEAKENDYELYKILVDTIDQVERNYVPRSIGGS